MVSGLHIGDIIPYRLDDASSLMPENNRKCTLGIFS
jgi:hypothetical protein